MGYFHFQDTENDLETSRWRKWFQGENAWKRICIAVIFVLSLASFLHFREVKVDVLELNTTAERYIIGQIDFDFPDVEAMMLLKQEEVRDIGSIYQIDPKQLRERSVAFEQLLIQDESWRENSVFTFDELKTGSQLLEKTLLSYRFTNARTMKRMEELGVSTNFYYQLSIKNKESEIALPRDFWKEVDRSLFPKEEFHAGVADFIVNFFSKTSWHLQEDLTRQIELRQMVEEKVPQKYTHFAAGRRIIDAGEKVSPRHIAILNAMKDALAKQRNIWDFFTILGSVILAVVLTIISTVYLRIYYREVFYSLHKLTLLITIMVLMLGIAKAAEYVLLHQANHLIDVVRYPIFVPFAVLLVGVLINKEIALFCLLFLTVVMSLGLAVNDAHFLAINLVTGVLALIYTKKMHKRRDVFIVCAKIWAYSIPVIIAFQLIEIHPWNINVVWAVTSTFISLLVIAILIVGFLPVFESVFDLMTDMTLIEYMDPSNELLRRLSLELPGTYQHCLVVGNISEAAANAIGANGLFCRVSTLYHDIGKLSNPHYFTENQLGGFNIHQLLTPLESAQVIMAHVRDGEALARKYRLPDSFIDIIREHHGTTLVYYFYHKQLSQTQKADPSQFRYLGPKPKSKESAIIMIADSVEAASRSIDEVTEETINALVEGIVSEKANDGQFDECQLTFEELGVVKKNMIRSLILAHHLRIKYPARKTV